MKRMCVNIIVCETIEDMNFKNKCTVICLISFFIQNGANKYQQLSISNYTIKHTVFVPAVATFVEVLVVSCHQVIATVC